MPGKRHEAEGTSEEGGELYTGYTTRVDVSTVGNGRSRDFAWKHVRDGGILLFTVIFFVQSGFSVPDTVIVSVSVGLMIYLFSYH